VVSSSVSPVLSSAVSFCASLPPGFRVGVVGSREFPALSLVEEFVSLLPSGVVVVSGKAEGVDQCAAACARSRGLVVDELPFVRGRGKAGGPVRNRELARSVAVLVVFRKSGHSPGSDSVASFARQFRVPLFVVSPPAPATEPAQLSLF
jgi:hypothetical protein